MAREYLARCSYLALRETVMCGDPSVWEQMAARSRTLGESLWERAFQLDVMTQELPLQWRGMASRAFEEYAEAYRLRLREASEIAIHNARVYREVGAALVIAQSQMADLDARRSAFLASGARSAPTSVLVLGGPDRGDFRDQAAVIAGSLSDAYENQSTKIITPVPLPGDHSQGKSRMLHSENRSGSMSDSFDLGNTGKSPKGLAPALQANTLARSADPRLEQVTASSGILDALEMPDPASTLASVHGDGAGARVVDPLRTVGLDASLPGHSGENFLRSKTPMLPAPLPVTPVQLEGNGAKPRPGDRADGDDPQRRGERTTEQGHARDSRTLGSSGSMGAGLLPHVRGARRVSTGKHQRTEVADVEGPAGTIGEVPKGLEPIPRLSTNSSFQDVVLDARLFALKPSVPEGSARPSVFDGVEGTFRRDGMSVTVRRSGRAT